MYPSFKQLDEHDDDHRFGRTLVDNNNDKDRNIDDVLMKIEAFGSNFVIFGDNFIAVYRITHSNDLTKMTMTIDLEERW